MRIAVACDGLETARLRSRCESFTCYTVENGVISGCCNVPDMSVSIQESIATLRQLDIDVLIARSFSSEFAFAVDAAGIERATRNEATPRCAAEAYLRATLMGEAGLAGAYGNEPLGELDDAFAKIEYRLLAQPA